MCCSFRVAILHHIRSDKHSVGKLTAHKLLLSQGHPSSLVTQIGHPPFHPAAQSRGGSFQSKQQPRYLYSLACDLQPTMLVCCNTQRAFRQRPNGSSG